MEERTDCITMVTEDGDEVVFSVLEETRIHGKDYLLVTDAPEDEDGECYILKDVSGEQEPDAVYEFVEDDRELDSVMGIFEALLSDADVDRQKAHRRPQKRRNRTDGLPDAALRLPDRDRVPAEDRFRLL